MTNHRAQFPAKQLSVDLDQVDVKETGFWWCLKCHRVTELLDSDTGLSGRRCLHCRSTKIEWKPAIASTGPLAVPAPLPHWVVEPEADAKPRQKVHRLPAEKRDLRVLARTGYFFCNACLQITERDTGDYCVLCKSIDVDWNEPVFKEEVA